MGWFSDLASGIKKVVSGGAPDIIGSVIKGGALAYGAYSAANANTEAARIAADSAAKQAATIREGNRLAQQRYDAVQADTAPARDYQKRLVVQDPNILTPAQQDGLAGARRDAMRQLAASGLMGAGRTVTKAIGSVEGDYRNRLIASNRARSDRAASGLSRQYYNAAGNSAMLDRGTGTQVAQTQRQSGDVTANAGLANASLTGAALGDITSIISNDLKRKGRTSAYNNDKNTVGEGS